MLLDYTGFGGIRADGGCSGAVRIMRVAGERGGGSGVLGFGRKSRWLSGGVIG